VRKKDSYLRAQFYRLKSRRGPQKAIVAVGASMLKAAFHMLRDDTIYRDLGGDHFDKTAKEKVTKRLARRFAEFGCVSTAIPLNALLLALRWPCPRSRPTPHHWRWLL
jgi:hypothetical protein